MIILYKHGIQYLDASQVIFTQLEVVFTLTSKCQNIYDFSLITLARYYRSRWQLSNPSKLHLPLATIRIFQTSHPNPIVPSSQTTNIICLALRPCNLHPLSICPLPSHLSLILRPINTDHALINRYQWHAATATIDWNLGREGHWGVVTWDVRRVALCDLVVGVGIGRHDLVGVWGNRGQQLVGGDGDDAVVELGHVLVGLRVWDVMI